MRNAQPANPILRSIKQIQTLTNPNDDTPTSTVTPTPTPNLVPRTLCRSFVGPSWTGRKGFVQQAIKEDGIRVPRNSGVLVCGHKEMGDEVKEIALKAGVLDGRVLSNF